MLEEELATCRFSTADTILLLIHPIYRPTTLLTTATHSGDRAVMRRNQDFYHSLTPYKGIQGVEKKNFFVFPHLSPQGVERKHVCIPLSVSHGITELACPLKVR